MTLQENSAGTHSGNTLSIAGCVEAKASATVEDGPPTPERAASTECTVPPPPAELLHLDGLVPASVSPHTSVSLDTYPACPTPSPATDAAETDSEIATASWEPRVSLGVCCILVSYSNSPRKRRALFPGKGTTVLDTANFLPMLEHCGPSLPA